MIGDIIRREMLTGQVDLKSMETQNCDEQPIIDTHTNHLTMLQSKIVSYMISKRFRQLNADVLINIDECHENDICLLIDDEPEPMPIDNHATGLVKVRVPVTIDMNNFYSSPSLQPSTATSQRSTTMKTAKTPSKMNSKNINEVANSQSKKRSSGQQNNVNGNTSSNTSVDGTTRNNHNVKKKNGLAGRIENDIETDRKINRPYAKRKEK